MPEEPQSTDAVAAREPAALRARRVLVRLVRSGAGGALATGVDLATLTVLVSLVHLSPHVASVPALLAGNVAMYFAQKLIAFGARHGRVGRELAWFALVQLGGFFLNIGVYELALRIVPHAAGAYVVVRLVTTNLVWLAYSFPLWHLVFRATPEAPDPPP